MKAALVHVLSSSHDKLQVNQVKYELVEWPVASQTAAFNLTTSI